MSENTGKVAKYARLYLMPQTECSTVPSYVEGLLLQETPGSYVLNPLMVIVEDPEKGPHYEEQGLNSINKTYVWRCQILDHMPDIEDNTELINDDGGGLG